MKAFSRVEFPWLEANRRSQDPNDTESMKYSKQEDNLNQNFEMAQKTLYDLEQRVTALEKVVKSLGG